MNVLIVSTSERSGGGAIAANRLMKALRKEGAEARMMVRDRQSDDPNVLRVGSKLPKLLERLDILPRCGFRKSRLWTVDTASQGISITRTAAFREADVIHLHWINQGMLSLDELERILSSGKRVVWTLHDEWPYLGVCHYRGQCGEAECRRCPLMKGSLPRRIRERKLAMYRRWHPAFVGCSQWITERAQAAMPAEWVEHINNCIPSGLFSIADKQAARDALALPSDKRLLLFVSQKVTDERKGIRYLAQALQALSASAGGNAMQEGSAVDLALAIVGRDSEKIPLPDGLPVYRFGSVGEEKMPQLYNAADVFLTPSLEDNLPNTIAEAMSCGTPCVGFNVGGIPEMISHMKNGYVARYRDADDLAAGIRYVLGHDLSGAAHSKAAIAYNETEVAQLYTDLYKG